VSLCARHLHRCELGVGKPRCTVPAADVHEGLVHGSAGGVSGKRQVVHHAVLVEARFEPSIDLARERRSLAPPRMAECADALEIDPADKRRTKSRVPPVLAELFEYETNVSHLNIHHMPQVGLASHLSLPIATPPRECRIRLKTVTKRG